MNPPGHQPVVEPEYFDPEEVDMSEQQFSASLERTEVRPEFVPDEPYSSNLLNPKREEIARPPASQIHNDPGPPATDSVAVDHLQEPETLSPSNAVVPPPSASTGEDWRELVSAKVKRYRTQKPHREHYPSLALQFEPVPCSSTSLPAPSEGGLIAPEVVEKEGAEFTGAHIASEPRLIASAAEPRIVLETTARVLEFPRPHSVRTEELADPVINQPRIVEAPELVPPPPAMGGILIEPVPAPEPERRPGFDMPLQSASIARKLTAGMLDGIVVGLAVALFCYVFTRVNGATPVVPLKSEAVFVTALVSIFWAAYQYAFLVRCKTTPGLLMTRLRVSRFDGSPAPRSLLRWRALASLLSSVSLGVGYAWCFLDEDQLTWHDRITRTHLAPK